MGGNGFEAGLDSLGIFGDFAFAGGQDKFPTQKRADHFCLAQPFFQVHFKFALVALKIVRDDNSMGW
jgi:hypothetical protein